MNNNKQPQEEKKPPIAHSTGSTSSLQASSPQQSSRQAGQAWWQPAVMMFVRMSGWIVAPVLLGTLLGRWLDEKYDTAPWMLVGTVGIAFVISMVGLVIEVTREYKKIEKDLNNKKDNQSKSV